MAKVFEFMDSDRQAFLKIKHDEAKRFVDPETSKIHAHMVERVNCPICDIDDASWVFSKAGFDFVKCRHCGLLHVESATQSRRSRSNLQGVEDGGSLDSSAEKAERAGVERRKEVYARASGIGAA